MLPTGPHERTFEVGLAHGSMAKARVWIEGPPPLGPQVASGRAERALDAPGGTGAAREVAVELYVPVGGKIDTALLVASYQPDDRGRVLRVEALTTGEDGPLLTWALAASELETVRAGLPEQYAQAIVEGAVEEGRRLQLGAGVLTFGQAAHGVVGSSPRIFARCAKLAVRLLVAPLSGMNSQSLVSILRGAWSSDETAPSRGLNEATATFRAFDKSLDPAAVSALLGLEPTSSARRGEERTSTSRTGERLVHGAWREGGWLLSSRLPRALTLEEHLHALLDLLEPRAEAVATLRGRGYRVDLYCGYFQRSGQGGPTFSPTLLARLAQLGLELGVDVFR